MSELIKADNEYKKPATRYSGYELSKLIPEEFRGSMPTIEEIEVELNE